MSFDKVWSEALLDGDVDTVPEIDDQVNRLAYAIRERMAVQHNAYADETGQSGVYEHKSGETNVLKVSAKADFPTPTSTAVGCLAIATDENNTLYYWNGSAWTAVGLVTTGGQTQTIAGDKTFTGTNTHTGDNTFNEPVTIDKADGTAPMTITSTTKVSNLNADLLDGYSYNETEIKPFGTWTAKSADISYQAATDGIVVAKGKWDGSGEVNLLVETDSNNPPTTDRVQQYVPVGSLGSNSIVSVTCPVKKGDYYKVTASNLTSVSIYWLPMGI